MRRDFGSRFWRLMECTAPLYIVAFTLFVAGQVVWRALL